MCDEFRSFIAPWLYGQHSHFYYYSGIEALMDYIMINYSDEEVHFYNYSQDDNGGVLFVAWIENGKLRSEVFGWKI